MPSNSLKKSAIEFINTHSEQLREFISDQSLEPGNLEYDRMKIIKFYFNNQPQREWGTSRKFKYLIFLFSFSFFVIYTSRYISNVFEENPSLSSFLNIFFILLCVFFIEPTTIHFLKNYDVQFQLTPPSLGDQLWKDGYALDIISEYINKKNDDGSLEKFRCHITQGITPCPVAYTENQHTFYFDFDALKTWLQDKDTNPFTNKAFSDNFLNEFLANPEALISKESQEEIVCKIQEISEKISIVTHNESKESKTSAAYSV